MAGGELSTCSRLDPELRIRVQEFSGRCTAVGLLDRLNGRRVRHRFPSAPGPGRAQHSLTGCLAPIEAIGA
ncbi:MULTISPECIES: hypothetical protein [unclassified Streptomyces]|uniref:hypothetical protein n=1 Tax=unclassified Streptomyces TaxID=2593676 RepID=UPI00210BA075|nr:hypothetical protein [Streptomyces sp. AVP053U2]